MKAIDVHGHIGLYDRGADSLADHLMSADAGLISRRARAAGICLTVVSHIEAIEPYGGSVVRANEAARQAAEEHPDIRFWAVLDPLRRETFGPAESLLAHPRCKGIKVHPVSHRYEIRERGDEIFEFAAAHKALILAHSGCPGSFPEDFMPFANRYPDATLILAHLGNSEDGNISRQVHAMKRVEAGNVYVDTSSARSIQSGLIEWAVSEIGPERILFGTDSPCYFPASQKARIEYAEIDEDAKRAILYGNAARLLGEEDALR